MQTDDEYRVFHACATIWRMDEIITDIVEALRAGEAVDDRALVRIVHAQLRRDHVDKRTYAKRRLLPFYLRVKREEPDRWRSWGITSELEERLLAVLRMKPRRTASGVATITVITKPWPCSGDCLFCPNDVRMPKSYLHREPACERAEQNWFDPYLQVSARLTALSQMGHATDKIELIVLGGTWSDYPEDYQIWFISELFRALNEGAAYPADTAAASGHTPVSGRDVSEAIDADEPEARDGHLANRSPDRAALRETTDQNPRRASGPSAPAPLPATVAARIAWYRDQGFPAREDELSAFAAGAQAAVNTGARSYNQAIHELYGASAPHRTLAAAQRGTWEELERLQHENESARHRVVGLVIETRPDAVGPEALMRIRRQGATKVQMGVQSLNQAVLDINGRGLTVEQIERAFAWLRIFGFKIHAHQMVSLLGATPELDRADYRRLVSDRAFLPDEVKLYPCALIESARLLRNHQDGSWRPYPEEGLLSILADDIVATPPYCRISRMIRDFSSGDIRAGNKKPNLRQLVEARLERGQATVREIRFREVGTGEVNVERLRMLEVPYETSVSRERFIEWRAQDNRIAGFLRLSLPDPSFIAAHTGEIPMRPGEAMIREVHIYGAVARLGEGGRAAQHLGLGRRLVERACEIAREAGYRRVNVISAVGTRAYYRALGFADNGLYQQREI